jgi:hypothetical protein
MQNIFKLPLFFALLFLTGCGESINSQLAGTMVGYVVAIDSTGGSHENSDVRISIDGTNYSTLSDSKGRWQLDNVVPGTYNISFTKDGYAMQKMIAYRFVGNGTDYLYTQTIYEILKTNVSLVIRPFENGAATFSCRVFRNNPSESLGGAVILLLGENPPFSSEEPDSYLLEYENFDSYYSFDAIRGYSFSIDSLALSKVGFHSQDKIYCEAFASNLSILQEWDPIPNIHIYGPSYIDIPTGKRVYTGFGNNKSEVKSFILP